MSIAVGTNSDILTEPMLFQISFGMRPDRYPPEKRQPLEHRVNLREITRVELVTPASNNPSPELQAVLNMGIIQQRLGEEYYVKLEFDGETSREKMDFRPRLPSGFASPPGGKPARVAGLTVDFELVVSLRSPIHCELILQSSFLARLCIYLPAQCIYTYVFGCDIKGIASDIYKLCGDYGQINATTTRTSSFLCCGYFTGKSKIEDVKSGLVALVSEVTSIAIPPLGCGNGGLDWEVVKPLIISAFAELPDLRIMIFEPSGAPAAENMPVATKAPNMTRARAILIKLLEAYSIPGYELSKLEIQKLAYFLQKAGEPLKLQYIKHTFGPYAANLNHVLKHIEGHFIRGYGDGTGKGKIYVLPTGSETAKAFLDNELNAQEYLERVSNLIYGFETPYGMELLATVHWVVIENPEVAEDVEKVISLVHEWSDRKRNLFKPEHIRKAWQRLHEQNWFGSLHY
jgi:O-acetyl-ADP-ribose deacetylase (regulator of RNase III)